MTDIATHQLLQKLVVFFVLSHRPPRLERTRRRSGGVFRRLRQLRRLGDPAVQVVGRRVLVVGLRELLVVCLVLRLGLGLPQKPAEGRVFREVEVLLGVLRNAASVDKGSAPHRLLQVNYFLITKIEGNVQY